ncbi:MAG: hypothetical protein D6694_15795, partial [Gammaproteobacteria bacterium]
IASPLVNLPLDQIELMPFAAATASAAIPAATDVAGWVGLLRTVTVTFTAVPDGVAAGQYAIINGEQYPIVATTATTVTLEYSSLLADPTGTPVVQFALWRFAGKYRGLSSYSRASRKTYIDPLTGQVTGAPAGFPAFERMADGGIGLLLEGSSTNLLLDSEAFDSANWTKSGLDAATPIIANAIAAPDGSMTADGLKEDAANTWKNIAQGGITANAGETITFSVYLKAGTQSWAGLTIRDGVSYLHTPFDLANGQVGTVATGVTAKIEAAANGFYRCSVTYTIQTGLTSVLIYVYNSATPGLYIGTGATAIYVWGAQIEALPFATSYIPTTTTTVTRAVDMLSIPAPGNIYPAQTERTIILDTDVLGLFSNITQYIWATDQLYDSMVINTAGMAGAQNGAGGWSNTAQVGDGNVHRAAAVVNPGGATHYVAADGIIPTNTAYPTAAATGTPTRLYIGSYSSGANHLYGHIRN